MQEEYFLISGCFDRFGKPSFTVLNKCPSNGQIFIQKDKTLINKSLQIVNKYIQIHPLFDHLYLHMKCVITQQFNLKHFLDN